MPDRRGDAVPAILPSLLNDSEWKVTHDPLANAVRLTPNSVAMEAIHDLEYFIARPGHDGLCVAVFRNGVFEELHLGRCYRVWVVIVRCHLLERNPENAIYGFGSERRVLMQNTPNLID
jgi:hypothetical protein